jgi:hypothetical protein
MGKEVRRKVDQCLQLGRSRCSGMLLQNRVTIHNNNNSYFKNVEERVFECFQR